MSGVIDLFLLNPGAVVFGAAGLLCQLTWPLFSRRRTMLAIQFGIGTNYGLQYALLEAWSGAGICTIGATQTTVAFFAGDRPWLRFMGVGFLPVAAAISWMTWSGWASLLALAACSLIMLGRLQSDTLRIRMFLLASAPFGMGYDLAVGAAPAFCGAVASTGISVAMLVREIRRRRAA